MPSPEFRAVIYLAHSSGGLWKSRNGGLSFASVFEAGQTAAVGAIAIDLRDPRRVLIGTGEGFPRNTAVYGDGVWLSTDGAHHWRNAGLTQSGSIAKIAIDPQNSKVVLAAAMGREFAPGGDRGIYRSQDGGRHWNVRILAPSVDDAQRRAGKRTLQIRRRRKNVEKAHRSGTS